MKPFFISLISTIFCSNLICCSFSPISFCTTINNENPNNVIVRGYFSDQLSNGLVFTRLETLKGNEDRDEIKVWNNVPFDCNGLHLRLASYLGNIDEEVIISLSQIDTVFFEGETAGDYRVPDGLWWETHSLKVLGDSIFGFIFPQSQAYTIHYDQFINKIIVNSECSLTSTNTLNLEHVKIFPTLVYDNIYIEHNLPQNKGKVEVYSLSGYLVFSSDLTPTINLSTLQEGMYIVVVRDKGNKYYHKKIIKI